MVFQISSQARKKAPPPTQLWIDHFVWHWNQKQTTSNQSHLSFWGPQPERVSSFAGIACIFLIVIPMPVVVIFLVRKKQNKNKQTKKHDHCEARSETFHHARRHFCSLGCQEVTDKVVFCFCVCVEQLVRWLHRRVNYTLRRQAASWWRTQGEFPHHTWLSVYEGADLSLPPSVDLFSDWTRNLQITKYGPRRRANIAQPISPGPADKEWKLNYSIRAWDVKETFSHGNWHSVWRKASGLSACRIASSSVQRGWESAWKRLRKRWCV